MTADLHRWLVGVELGLALATVVSLVFVTAPYGRHVRAGWGPTVRARWGWVLMEAPASLGFAVIFLMTAGGPTTTPLVLLGLWQLHYVQRTFVYPFRLRDARRPMPVLLVALGAAFNVLNASVNAPWIASLGGYTSSWLADPRFIAGSAIFLLGLALNWRSDGILLRLRAPGDTAYRIPTGGGFRWVSCPNYLGEIVEWFGWALLTWSLAGLAFALYTAANLVPRALAHHRWYRSHFADYPTERRALIPRVL